jgi:hypothetical protein
LGSHPNKITFSEPNQQQRKNDVHSLDSYLRDVDESLKSQKLKIWVLIDRLDVAFADTPDLEKNAIRALFRVYGDLRSMENLNLKIFIRTDIWNKITEDGFREASHVTKGITLSWDESSLLNLVSKRLINNANIRSLYNIDAEKVLSNANEQEKIYDRIFPEKVESGSRRPKSFPWILSRTVDGSGKFAPREVVAFLGHLVQKQLERFERGEPEPKGENLFEGSTFKIALPILSLERLTQTLFAEYPAERFSIELLKKEKCEQTLSTLAKIWDLNSVDCLLKADRLVEIGFFERRGPKDQTTYWIPFIYRSALELVQGRADDE